MLHLLVHYGNSSCFWSHLSSAAEYLAAEINESRVVAGRPWCVVDDDLVIVNARCRDDIGNLILPRNIRPDASLSLARVIGRQSRIYPLHSSHCESGSYHSLFHRWFHEWPTERQCSLHRRPVGEVFAAMRSFVRLRNLFPFPVIDVPGIVMLQRLTVHEFVRFSAIYVKAATSLESCLFDGTDAPSAIANCAELAAFADPQEISELLARPNSWTARDVLDELRSGSLRGVGFDGTASLRATFKRWAQAMFMTASHDGDDTMFWLRDRRPDWLPYSHRLDVFLSREKEVAGVC